MYSVPPLLGEAAGRTVGWLHWGGFTLGMEVAAGVENEGTGGVLKGPTLLVGWAVAGTMGCVGMGVGLAEMGGTEENWQNGHGEQRVGAGVGGLGKGGSCVGVGVGVAGLGTGGFVVGAGVGVAGLGTGGLVVGAGVGVAGPGAGGLGG